MDSIACNNGGCMNTAMGLGVILSLKLEEQWTWRIEVYDNKELVEVRESSKWSKGTLYTIAWEYIQKIMDKVNYDSQYIVFNHEQDWFIVVEGNTVRITNQGCHW